MRIGYRQVGLWLVILGAFAIAVATLTPVPESVGGGTSRICLICHDRGMSDFISNIILFSPLGIGLALRNRSWQFALAVGALFSLSVELLQLDIVTGRDANFGDLVANSLGAITGWLVGARRDWWRPRRERAARRALALTGLLAILLLAALSLFRAAPQDTIYYLQWMPSLGGMHTYRGTIVGSSLGGLTLPGPGRIAHDDSVRALLVQPAWSVTFVAGPPPRRIAPIVSIYDEHEKEVMLLGAAGPHLVYRQHLLASALRFDAADLRIAHAFDGLEPGRETSLSYSRTDREQCAVIDGREQCVRGYTIGDTWSLVMFPDSWPLTLRTAMGVAWLFGLFSLAGFLAPGLATLLVQAGVALLLLVPGPAVLGFATTPPHQALSILAGLICGWLAARLTHGHDEGREPFGIAPSGADPGRPPVRGVSSA